MTIFEAIQWFLLIDNFLILLLLWRYRKHFGIRL
jgi:hypothetical protein